MEQVEQPEPDEVLPNFPLNIDTNRFVFFDLHAGQTTSRFSFMEINRVSKTLWHFLHLNS